MTNDEKVLRDLAYVYREYAFSEENKQKKELHKAVSYHPENLKKWEEMAMGLVLNR